MHRRRLLAILGSAGSGGCLRLTEERTEPVETESTTRPTTRAPTAGETTTRREATETTRSEETTRATPDLTRQWRVNASGEGIAVRGETVFVQTAGVVTAVDAVAGEKLWELNLGVATGGAKPFGFGESLIFTAGDGTVFAIDPSGPRVRWKRATQFEEVRDLMVHRGQLYAVDFERREENAPAGLYAFDTDSGTEEWRVEYRSEDEDRWPRQLAAVGDVLYVGMFQGVFEYDLAEGAKRTYETDDGSSVEYNPALAGGFYSRDGDVLWLAGSRRGRDVLQKYDPVAGEVLRESEIHGTVRTKPVLTEAGVVIGTNSGFFSYSRSDGAKRWEKLTRERPYMATAVGDVSVVSDRSRTMYGVSSSGEVLFEESVEKTYHSLASVGDTLVVATENVTGYSLS